MKKREHGKIRRFLEGIVLGVSSIVSSPYTLVPIAAVPFVTAGCFETKPICPEDERGKLYCERNLDLEDTIKKLDPADQVIDRTILNATNKLARSIYPDHMPFPNVDKTMEPLKKTLEKKKIGLLEIFFVDMKGVNCVESYTTDFMNSCVLSNLKLGENFAVAERFKLMTVMKELDLQLTADFDPADAIRRGYFKGVDVVVTGSIYHTSSVNKTSERGDTTQVYRGGLKVLIRAVDSKTAVDIGTVSEYIPWSPATEQWINRQVLRR